MSDRISIHEDFGRQREVKGSSDRMFGLVFTAFFLLVAFAPLRSHHAIRWWALVTAIPILFVALVSPAWLHPFNRVWTKLGLILGRVVSPIVLGLLFFVVVTPTGFLVRLLGKDPLRLTSDPESNSYWIERRPPGPKPETMEKQF